MRIYNTEGKRNIVGERIKKARESYGWSQSVLAAKLQIEDVILEQKAVSRIELGNRLVTDYELVTISKVLNVTIEWLLTGENNKAL